MNGYITAIDTDTNQVVWRSQPQVCNARNFLIVDGVIICGYGFTAEPDFIYILDKNSGKILQQIPVATAVDYLIKKDDKLYVRTYDTNYIFEIVQ
jgi:glucose dehydrogenase